MKDEIRQRLDLREIVSEYVALKPSGPNKWKGLSPFSKEKSPSFYVNTTKQVYYCFSTKQGGDVFDFVMKVEGISFREAMEKLAVRAGVQLESYKGDDKRRRDLYEVNTLALEFFRKNLPGSEALAYLERRGVSPEMIEAFGLGWVPAGYDNLLKFAKARNVSERELLEAGLLSESAENGRVYDRFRGRVMFPIKDYLGRVIAFGGRVLDDSKPKYLNSPETEVFKKHDTLYGLEMARKHIQETGDAVVVEGYMDVIAMHQHGFHGAVASLGTALTQDHAHLLSRQGARRLALLFDNDPAGQRATLAGLDQEIGKMFLVRAVVAPGGKDAADILLAGGQADLQAALNGGLTEVEVRLNAVLEKFDVNTLDGKRGALQALLPRLRPRDVFDPVALDLQRMVIDRLGLEPKRLDEYLNANKPNPRSGASIDRIQVSGLMSRGVGSGDRGEIRLAQLLVQNPALTAKLDGEAMFENPLVAEIIEIARTATTSDQILEHFRGRPEASMLFEGLMDSPESVPGQDALAVDEISSRKREESLKRELATTKAQLSNVTSDEQIALLRQCSELQRAIEAERRLRLRN